MAADESGLALPSSSILVHDVLKGTAHKWARASSRIENDIVAACKGIAAIWPEI